MRILVPCFDVLPPSWVETGIRVSPGREIVLGEQGRGRKETRVRVPGGSVFSEDGKVVLQIPVSHPDAAAVICIRDFSGYKGTWDLLLPIPDDLLRLFDQTGQYDVLQGRLQETTPPLLIAYGRRAQGMAGRVGQGDELLFIAKAGDEYDIFRWGRIYGAPRILRLRVGQGTVTVTDVLAELRARDAEARW
jgi:hypothetical protein